MASTVDSQSSPSPSLPAGCVCPITCELLFDPVILADGHTYERWAITEWLEDHDTSPVTNELLSSKLLVPNWCARQYIEEWAKTHAVDTVDSQPKGEV